MQILLKEKLLEEKNPNEVYPTEYETAADGNDDADDKSEKSALLKEGAPSYEDLGDPVNEGDKKKEKLNDAALLIEPSHN